MTFPVRILWENFTIEGKSRAGNETYFRIRELGISLDIGRCPDPLISVPHIFVTHAHLDHALGIPFYAAQRRLRQLAPGTVYVPGETVDDYRALMALHEKLEHTQYPLHLVGMAPGDRVRLRPDLSVLAHRATHRVPSIAYEFLQVRKHLRPEFLGMEDREIAHLREIRDDLLTEQELSLLFYTGDTDRRIFDLGEAIFQSEVLIIECSFVGEDDQDRAARYAHIHVDDLYAQAERFENRLIVLTHFSLRHSAEEIHRQISDRCPASLRSRIRLALPEPYVRL